MINKIATASLSAVSLICGSLIGLSICLNLNAFTPAKSTLPQVLGVKSNETSLDLNFSTITNGSITATGNTLTISPSQKRLQELSKPNVSPDFGDVFISLDKGKTVDSYPNFTTRDWKENGSFAALEIPSGGEILHSRLIWGGIYKHNKASMLDQINSEVSFVTPQKTVRVKTTANSTYTQDVTNGSKSRSEYIQSVDVTDIMKTQESGIYGISQVPSLLSTDFSRDDPENFAGWTLVVAYKDENASIKNLSIFSGLKNIAPENDDNGLISLSGFVTPESVEQKGQIYLSAGEGDGAITGDQVLFGSDIQNLTQIKSIEGSSDNFFSSHINTNFGKLDTRGSFGSFNSDINKSDYIKRQGYDITSSDISSQLKPNQTTAIIQPTTTGDGYSLNMAAMEIEVNAANLNITSTVDKDVTIKEDELNYVLEVENTGKTTAQNIKIEDFLPKNTSIEIFDNPQAKLENGIVYVDNLAPNQKIQIKYSVTPNTDIKRDDRGIILTTQPKITYSYKLAFNQEFTYKSSLSNPVSSILVWNSEKEDETLSLKEEDIITPNQLETLQFINPSANQVIAEETIISDLQASLDEDFINQFLSPNSELVDNISVPELTLFDQIELLIPDLDNYNLPQLPFLAQKDDVLVNKKDTSSIARVTALVRTGADYSNAIIASLVLISLSLMAYAGHLVYSNRSDKT